MRYTFGRDGVTYHRTTLLYRKGDYPEHSQSDTCSTLVMTFLVGNSCVAEDENHIYQGRYINS